METKIAAAILLAGLFIWVNIFFHWPLREYYDYMSYIALAHFVREYGLYSTAPNWAGGYSVWFNNAPVFPAVTAALSYFISLKSAFVLALFLYLLMFLLLIRKLTKNWQKIFFITLGSGLAYKWIFKTGRVPELCAQIFSWILIFYLMKEKKPDPKIIALLSLLVLMHHPLVSVFPVLFMFDRILFEKEKRKEILTGIVLFFFVGSFYAVPLVLTNLGVIGSMEKSVLLAHYSPIRMVETVTGYLSLVLLLSREFLGRYPLYSSFFVLSLLDVVSSSFFSYRILHIFPGLGGMYELTPLLHYLPILLLFQRDRKKIQAFVLLQLLFFIGREIFFIHIYGVPDFAINPEFQIKELNAALAEINGTFDYYSSSRIYPTEITVPAYAAVRFNLSTYRSGFPEFEKKEIRVATKEVRKLLALGKCNEALEKLRKLRAKFVLLAGFNCPGKKFGNFTLIKVD